MRKAFLFIALIAFSCLGARAQTTTGGINGFCSKGSTKAQVQGQTSTNTLQGIVPLCTVTVYLTGTLTKATLFADANNTPLTNPFTASTIGQWLFFASNSAAYDIVLSGGNPPNNYTTSVTFTDVGAGGGGGGGGGGGVSFIGAYGADACASILSLINSAGIANTGGYIQFSQPFTTVPCAFNAAGAPPYGAISYNQTTHAATGPSIYLNLGSVAIQSDVQWVNPFKSTLFGNAMISGASGGTTILASTNFVPWLQGCVFSGSAPLITLTGCSANNAGGSVASFPFGLTGGNFIKVVGSGTCLDNAWRVDSSTNTSITIYYVQPGSGCTPPSFPVTVTKIYVPLVVNGNSSNGGAAGYGGVDAGAFIHDLAIDCNPQGSAAAPHPQNCIAMAGFTWNEGSGIENVDLKNTTSIGLDIEVPAIYGTGATGHPADYFVRNTNILVDPFYTNNPTSNVDSSICEYVNTHGDPFWYQNGQTCKVVSGGTEAADAMQIIGTQGGVFTGMHIEGFQHCIHFIAPTAPEASLNRAVKILNESCGVFNTTATPANILIDSGSGFPIDLDTITGLPSGGAIVSDSQSGFNTAYTGGDTVDAFLNHYSSLAAGGWRIDSTSYASSINGGGDSCYANSGGCALTLGNNASGTLTPYAKLRSVSSAEVLSCEVVGGCPIDFRTQGTSTATQSVQVTASSLILEGTTSTQTVTINYPTAFTGTHVASWGDYGGQFNLNDALHTGGMTCYNSSGQSTTGTTCSLTGAFNGTGTTLANFHNDQDVGTLSGGTLAVVLSGSSVFLNGTTYSCNARDTTTQSNAVTVTVTDGTHFTLTGTGTDSVLWQCNGR